MNLYEFRLARAKPLDIIGNLHDLPYSLFFDSADPAHKESCYSFIAYNPMEVIEATGGICKVTNKTGSKIFDGNPFELVQERLAAYGLDKLSVRQDTAPIFKGGAAGYFGYDLARSLENLPATSETNPGLPDMAIGLYDRVYAYNHKTEEATLFVLSLSQDDANTIHQHFLSLANKPQPHISLTDGCVQPHKMQWQSSHTASSYQDAVQQVIDYIYAGDIFQANFSQRFLADLPAGFCPFDHYLHLREMNPAPFAAYMNFGGFQIASASPERFLKLHNRQVETCPIKGTITRSPDAETDQQLRTTLQKSEKDRAENMMIVDLLRNDLSKVCEDHSVDATQLCVVESFAKVHHLVSTIRGTLRIDKAALDLLPACFPGGSITGAPKIRTMEIIEELETSRRGPYCGAIGYIGADGTMDTNIVIRTLVFQNNTVQFNVGGGIVADSHPHAEYEETLTKAEALFRSFDRYEQGENFFIEREK